MESSIVVQSIEEGDRIQILCEACGEFVEFPSTSPLSMLEATRQSFEVLHEDCQEGSA